MNQGTRGNPWISPWTSVIPLVLLAIGAAAQTTPTAEQLRAALKSELAPLRLSIKDQARTVVAEMAEDVIRELATAMAVGTQRPQLAVRDRGNPEDDNS